MRITVWKSDFKDFPWLWQAAYYCEVHIVQRAKNFIVFEGCNPYEIARRYPSIRRGIKYNDFVDLLKRLIQAPNSEISPKEKQLLKIIKKRVDNLQIDMDRAASMIESSLSWYSGHVNRYKMLEHLAYGGE